MLCKVPHEAAHTSQPRAKRSAPMMKPFLLVTLLFTGRAALAASSVMWFSCPPQLDGTEQHARQVPEGWEATVQDAGPKHMLTGFTINLGPASKSDGTIYDDVKETTDRKGNVTSRLIWNVKPLEDAYAVCAYTRTSLVLTRSLKGYSECVATSRRSKDTQFQMEEVVCR